MSGAYSACVGIEGIWQDSSGKLQAIFVQETSAGQIRDEYGFLTQLEGFFAAVYKDGMVFTGMVYESPSSEQTSVHTALDHVDQLLGGVKYIIPSLSKLRGTLKGDSVWWRDRSEWGHWTRLPVLSLGTNSTPIDKKEDTTPQMKYQGVWQSSSGLYAAILWFADDTERVAEARREGSDIPSTQGLVLTNDGRPSIFINYDWDQNKAKAHFSEFPEGIYGELQGEDTIYWPANNTTWTRVN